MSAANTPSGSKFNVLRRTFAAGQEFTFQADCHFVYFQEASFGFDVALDNGPYIPMNLALGFKCAEGEAITCISIKNTLSVESSFVLTYGRGTIIDQRLNVLESRNGSSASLIPNGVQSATSAGVAIAGTVTLAANPNRKEALFSVTKLSAFVAGDELNITAGGFLVKKIRFHAGAQDSFISCCVEHVPTTYTNTTFVFCVADYSGELVLTNNTGATVTVAATEKIYS